MTVHTCEKLELLTTHKTHIKIWKSSSYYYWYVHYSNLFFFYLLLRCWINSACCLYGDFLDAIHVFCVTAKNRVFAPETRIVFVLDVTKTSLRVLPPERGSEVSTEAPWLLGLYKSHCRTKWPFHANSRPFPLEYFVFQIFYWPHVSKVLLQRTQLGLCFSRRFFFILQ